MKRRTANQTTATKQQDKGTMNKSTVSRIKDRTKDRKKIMEELEECVDVVGNNYANYLAWLHFGKLIRREIAADLDLNLRYTGIKNAIKETLTMNGKHTLDLLKQYLECPRVPDPVA